METNSLFKSKLLVMLLSIGVLSGYSNALAQDTDSGGTVGGDLVIGAKLGINFNQFSQPGTTIGANIGGFVRYPVLDFLEVQGDLFYSLQGGGRMEYTRDYSLSGSSSDGPIDFIQYVNRSIQLHVVEVPITARLTLPELNGGNIVPKLIIGGSYSYNFSAIEKNDKIINFVDGTRGLVSNTTDDVSLNYFPHNFSIHAGIALDINLTNENVFTMEFKYRVGLTNLNQAETTITELTDKLYSSAFSLNFAYPIFF